MLLAWKEELRQSPTEEVALRRRIEQYVGAGHGACHLRDPRIARLVQEALLHFDAQRYRLFAWVVRPTHGQGLLETWEGVPLHAIMRSWKSFTARRANPLLDRRGAFWQVDYFDRYVRNEAHWQRVVAYIHENPVKAGLVGRAQEWMWGRAYVGRAGGPRSQEGIGITSFRGRHAALGARLGGSGKGGGLFLLLSQPMPVSQPVQNLSNAHPMDSPLEMSVQQSFTLKPVVALPERVMPIPSLKEGRVHPPSQAVVRSVQAV